MRRKYDRCDRVQLDGRPLFPSLYAPLSNALGTFPLLPVLLLEEEGDLEPFVSSVCGSPVTDCMLYIQHPVGAFVAVDCPRCKRRLLVFFSGRNRSYEGVRRMHVTIACIECLPCDVSSAVGNTPERETSCCEIRWTKTIPLQERESRTQRSGCWVTDVEWRQRRDLTRLWMQERESYELS